MLAIDWGLSSFRAWRLGADGAVTAALTAPRGISLVPPAGYAEALAEVLAPWPGASAEPALLCGMVGSRQGWVEAPYAPCPARAADIAAALIPLPDRPGSFIVPGLSCRNGGVADVMRGEETQILGLLPLLGPGRHTLCLPGTHSKWAVVEDGAIVAFRTAMTGELFALMRRQSTLAPLMPEGKGDDDEAAFAAGVARAAGAGGLTHHLFGIRAATLLGDLRAEAAASFLSGLLIGHEIGSLAAGAGTVHVVGSPGLTDRYARALAAAGHTPVSHGEETAAHGLSAIAASRGML
ncbi:2-dehydro-3-deoxygalactonokinase [Elioraea sp.]|uniref:2-dehydro-3-deoxygalactonokinase n=1 Tax=Elioraea sp. TaxID=2185103 RepID=UPI0025C33EA7|nr:2-dehydro-3-deoxygalactonokinase [Elioraea sp.]